MAAAAGTTFDERAPLTAQFTLGGPFRLGSYYPDELRGSHYAFAGAGGMHELVKMPLFVGGSLYLIGTAEVGSTFEGRIAKAQFSTSFSVGVGTETAFGAFYLGGAVGDKSSRNWYLSIGRLF